MVGMIDYDELDNLTIKEIDVAVATIVFGWQWQEVHHAKFLCPPQESKYFYMTSTYDLNNVPSYLPPFCISNSLARETVEKVKSSGIPFMITNTIDTMNWNIMVSNGKRSVSLTTDSLEKAFCFIGIIAYAKGEQYENYHFWKQRV